MQDLKIEMTFQKLMGISENRSITKLKVYDQIRYENVDELNHFADEHPHIEQLILERSVFDEDGAITLVFGLI